MIPVDRLTLPDPSAFETLPLGLPEPEPVPLVPEPGDIVPGDVEPLASQAAEPIDIDLEGNDEPDETAIALSLDERIAYLQQLGCKAGQEDSSVSS